MLRFAAVMACGLMLGGCGAGVQYVVDNYRGVELKTFEVPDEDTYRVFDKPAENRLMITPSLGTAAAYGAVSGATFGAANVDGPKPIFERAALGYLASTGRTCRMLDGYIVARPQWEFKYDCSIPPAPTAQQPAQASKRRRG